MLLDLKAHTLRVENDLKKKQAEDIFDTPEFKVCVSFRGHATTSNQYYSRPLYKSGFLSL